MKLKIPATVRIRKVRGEALLLDLDTEACFGLDAVGLAIWNGIETHGNLTRVIDGLLEEFDIDRKTVEADVNSLVGEMLERNLLIALENDQE